MRARAKTVNRGSGNEMKEIGERKRERKQEWEWEREREWERDWELGWDRETKGEDLVVKRRRAKAQRNVPNILRCCDVNCLSQLLKVYFEQHLEDGNKLQEDKYKEKVSGRRGYRHLNKTRSTD